MNKLFIVLTLLLGSLNAMDPGHAAQVAREHKHIEVLKSFQKEEFIRNPLSQEQVTEALKELEGLRSTAGYTDLMNQALLALSKKSEWLGNLKQELLLAQRLIKAGADIEFNQTNIILFGRSSQMGHPAVTKTESVFGSARGDLKEFLEIEWAENSHN